MLKKAAGLITAFAILLSSFSAGASAAEGAAPFDDATQIFAYEDFSNYLLEDESTLENTAPWTLETVSSGTRGTSFTLETDPLDTSNRVMGIKHYKKNGGSTKVTNERFGQNFPGAGEGRIEITYKIMPAAAGDFNVYILKDSAVSTDPAVKIETAANGKTYVSYYAAEADSAITGKAKNFTFEWKENEWTVFKIVTDTKQNLLEITVSNSAQTVSKSYEAYFKNKIGGFRMEIPRGSDINTMYTDDIFIYADYSEALENAALTVNAQMITNEPLDQITKDIFSLPPQTGDFGILWSSDAPGIINTQSGRVTQRKFAQNANITATLTADSQIQFYKNATKTLKFPVTVLPYGSFTDEEILDDYLSDITWSSMSEEPIDAVTKNLSFSAAGQDGISVEYESSNTAVLSNDGTVTRPTDGENKTAELTVRLRRGSAQREKKFNITVVFDMTVQYKVEQAKKAITAAAVTSQRPDAVTKNIILPTEGLYATSIRWISSDESVITNDGIVTRGETDKTVTLTAYITLENVTEQTSFDITVKMSENAMARADRDALIIREGVVSAGFKLPQYGSLYQSTVVWTSDNTAITPSGGYALITAPSFEEGDASVKLTAKIKHGESDEFSKEFYFSVLAEKSDEELVQSAYEMLDESIGAHDGDSIEDNLVFRAKFPGDVLCSYTVSDPDVIKSNGEVENPAVGETAKSVTVTAKLKKNSAVRTKTYNFTVMPFESTMQLLQKARQALGFNMLCQDEINAVKSNLTLPSSWKYGTHIQWSSSDEEALLIAENESSAIGLINRPQFGEGVKTATLTAKLCFGEESVTKSFNISIAEQIDYQTTLLIDNEEGILGQTPVVPYGKWTPAASENSSFVTGIDPENDQNKVIEIFRAASSQKPSGTNNSRYSMQKEANATYGKSVVSLKMYIDEDTENDVSFSIRSTGGAQVSVIIKNDGKVILVSEDNLQLNAEYAPPIQKGKWVELTFYIDNPKKMYTLYADGVLMTENGLVTLNGAAYDTTDGIRTIYYSNEQKPSNIYGFDISLSNIATTKDSAVYLDDICVMRQKEYDSEMLLAAQDFETKFTALNNLAALRKNLVFPSLTYDGCSVSYYSADTSVLLADGTVKRPEEDTAVEFCAVFFDGNYYLRKSFLINVLHKDPSEPSESGKTETELLNEDLQQAKNAITENYQLTNITGNITLLQSGANGSVISYRSSNESVISETGVVSRANTDVTVTLTIKAQRNGLSAETELTLIVKSKPSVSTGGGGSPSGGSVIGKSSGKQSGIDIDALNREQIMYFSDVEPTHWAYGYITELYKKGIVSRDEKFRCDDAVTRAEFIKMLVEAGGIDKENAEASFSDVSETQWFAPYIGAAERAGIANGKEDGRFYPEESISRQDAALLCQKLIQTAGQSEITAAEVWFSDSADISDYATEAVRQLAFEKIIVGDNGAFRPHGFITRAEACSLISKMLGRYFDDKI